MSRIFSSRVAFRALAAGIGPTACASSLFVGRRVIRCDAPPLVAYPPPGQRRRSALDVSPETVSQISSGSVADCLALWVRCVPHFGNSKALGRERPVGKEQGETLVYYVVPCHIHLGCVCAPVGLASLRPVASLANESPLTGKESERVVNKHLSCLGAVLKLPKNTTIGLLRHGVTCLWELNVRKPRPTEDFAAATEEAKPTPLPGASMHNYTIPNGSTAE
ncbi:hypothetical protein AUP68_17449 [Ilyonectria robusta]